jgi:ribonuclease P protein component
LRFPKSSKIRSSADFATVRGKGRTTQSSCLRLSCHASGDQPTRFGIVTSRRVGGAVVRNKVRRRIREIIRSAMPDIRPGLLVVTIAKPGAAGASFDTLRSEWLLLARRLSILPQTR